MKTKEGFKKCPFCGQLPETSEINFVTLEEGRDKGKLYWIHFCGATNGSISITGESAKKIKHIWNRGAKK